MESEQYKSQQESPRESQKLREPLTSLSISPKPPHFESPKPRKNGVYFQWNLTHFTSPELISNNLEILIGHSVKDYITGTISYFDIMHPEDRQIVLSTIQTYISNSLPYFELPHYRLCHKNGQTLWVNHSMIRTNQGSNEAPVYTGVLFDITEKITQDAEIRNHDNQLHFLLNSPIFPVVITSINDGRILYINDLASTYFKIPAEEAIGHLIPDYWLDKPDNNDFFKQVLQNNAVNGYEATLKDHTGEEKCALLSTTIVTYAKQKAYFTVFSDITDRKRTERALKNSEVRYHDLYNMMKLMTDTAPDMIWAKDINNSYIFANKAVREHLQKRNESDPHSTIPPEKNLLEASKNAFTEICRASDNAIKRSRKPSRFLEDGYIQGEYLALDVYKTPLLDEQGQLIGTVGVGRDVTQDIKMQKDLQKSEERYRLLAENVRDVIWILDANLNPTFVTPSIKQLSGYSPDEFLETPLKIHLPSGYQKKLQVVKKLFRKTSGGSVHDPSRYWECEFKRKDGQIIWIETTASRLPSKDGKLDRYICITRETTKRVKEQQELVEAKETALAASKTKSEFLANMSHEIRTPMNGVLGMLQLLKETPLNKEQLGYTQTALDSGKILLSLISDVLDFSKIEAGRLELAEESFALEPLLQSTIDSFYNTLKKKEITTNLSLHDKIPDHIITDPSRLRQIITNLIGNAVKFTEKGNISLETNFTPIEDGQRARLSFKIADQGIGIPEQIVKRIFEPFVQADGSTSRKYGGTGLGLSIVRNLVEEMGGSVDLKSTVGKGTTAYFDIIVRMSQKRKKEQKLEEVEITRELQPMHILMVEDEKINAMVLSAMLNNFGQQVTHAANGREAIELTIKKRFDCILMDIQMPTMDGIETTKRIRSSSENHCNKTPIIALTAHAMTGDRERFLAAGMTDYLSKPVTTSELHEVLHRASIRSLT